MARVNDDGQVLSLQMSHASLQRMWAEAFMYALVSRSYGLLSVHVEGCFVIRLQDKSSKGPSGWCGLCVRVPQWVILFAVSL